MKKILTKFYKILKALIITIIVMHIIPGIIFLIFYYKEWFTDKYMYYFAYEIGWFINIIFVFIAFAYYEEQQYFSKKKPYKEIDCSGDDFKY